ncbi:MAG: 8-oxoguanine deaminase [Anaerolineales bacterium]|nr:8-oxoguanine deaminase [Anaerolineales bacterium]
MTEATLLVNNIHTLVTMDEERQVLQDAWILVRGGMIDKIGTGSPPAADRTIDASGHIVLPGLVNTHHHFFQTLLRGVPSMQNNELFPWLEDLYLLMAGMTDEMVYVSTQVAVAELMLSGCTTAQDHSYLHVNDMKFETEIAAAQELGVRFHLSRGSFDVGQSQGYLPPDEVVEDHDEILADCEALIKGFHEYDRFGMVRIELAPCSPFSVTESLMEKSAEMAEKYSVGLTTHLCETHDEEQFCLDKFGKTPVQFAADLGWMGERTWYAHFVHAENSNIDVMAQTGTGVAHCPGSNARLGSGIARVNEMLKKGVKVGLGVDGSASNDSSHMLAEVRLALLFQRAKYGADALTATQALELATLGGAEVLGRNDIGALKHGMAADFIGIKLNQLGYAGGLHDPVAALVLCEPVNVDFSVINGKVVVEDGSLSGLDLEQLKKQQNKLAAALVQKAEKRYSKNMTSWTWRRRGE